jgi:hypothetical protein
MLYIVVDEYADMASAGGVGNAYWTSIKAQNLIERG